MACCRIDLTVGFSSAIKGNSSMIINAGWVNCVVDKKVNTSRKVEYGRSNGSNCPLKEVRTEIKSFRQDA